MKNLENTNFFQITDSNYILNNTTLNIDLIKNLIDFNTSILYFDENFNTNDPIYTMFLNKFFDKLILIPSKEHNIKNVKRLFVCSKVNKKILSHVKKNILIIVKLSNNYKYMKKIINNIINLKSLSTDLNIKIGIDNKDDNKTINCIVIGDSNSKYFFDLIYSFKAIFIDNITEKYEYIYDTVCEYLDSEFSKNNFCDFKNDSCIANRKKYSSHSTMGCCYSFEYSKFWEPTFIKNIKVCNHLNCKTCNTKCISCKLYTCKYLKDNNIQFKIDNILLLDCFFTKSQFLILKYNFFHKREEIINKLLEHNKKPLLIYYLKNEYFID